MRCDNSILSPLRVKRHLSVTLDCASQNIKSYQQFDNLLTVDLPPRIYFPVPTIGSTTWKKENVHDKTDKNIFEDIYEQNKNEKKKQSPFLALTR